MFRQHVSVLFCLYFLGLSQYLSAMTDEQRAKVHAHFESIGMQCIQEFPITEEDIANLRAKKVASGDNAPCFVACVMKKIGVMDEKGMLQKESAMDLTRKVFEDEEEIKMIEDFLHSCSHVNDATVSDGDKGCERAIITHKCMIDNAGKFGLDL